MSCWVKDNFNIFVLHGHPYLGASCWIMSLSDQGVVILYVRLTSPNSRLMFVLIIFYIDINECASNPCENAGQCVDGVASFTCRCTAGFRGTRCEESELRLGPMMTSSNGNIFRITGHLCGEFTGHRWIPHTKASDVKLWCFLWSEPE